MQRLLLILGVSALTLLVGCAGPPAEPVTTDPAASDGTDRLARGIAVLDGFEAGASDRVLANYADLAPHFGRYVVEYPFGEIYARQEQLDARTRLLAAVAALTAVGDSEYALKAHIRYALGAGCTQEEVVEVIVQTNIYAGFPRSVRALEAAREVFADAE